MKKLLLIEDNLDVRETTADILTLAGYDVQTAENGKIGVEKAKQFLPNIIICDIMMPVLDGYGVLHILGKHTETAHIPFIFLTAKADKTDLRKGMNLGADDYLTKPFEENDLLDAIEIRLKKNDILKKEYSKNISGINAFFDEVSQFTEFKDLSKDRSVQSFSKKMDIFQEGFRANQLYFIESGKVKTYKTSETGKDFITGMYGSGDFIGYMPLLGEDNLYTENATVLEDAKICSIPKDDFTTLIYGNKQVSKTFINMLSNNLLEKETQLVEIAYASVRQRVAKVLVDLYTKEKTPDRKNVELYITRDDLAGLVGAAKETVIRTLSGLKGDNLIEIESKRIILNDVDMLERISQSSYL
ncbi:response regulator [Winogradskyella bathintestinalis]|uniref:Response regulator n=1 Tax=Winogradskyella bathintestinalis TaxID=3035208 RepID=A0ABT7ZWX5_9FLAO|nr:response regulator [Winogradskyella bathintestinalis]MDN3493238.1 response regulator [Winogradskyella bathintestinalis]